MCAHYTYNRNEAKFRLREKIQVFGAVPRASIRPTDLGPDLAVEVREYFIPDFSNWKDHDAFESAFSRLKKDLEAENLRKR